MTEEPQPQLPIGDRGYLACRHCRLVLTEMQFLRDGCSVCNSGPIRREELQDFTTAEFSNFIGLIAPEKSWVARLIGKTECPNGVFAAVLNDCDEEDEELDEEESGSEEFGDIDEEEEFNDGDLHGRGELRRVMTDEELLASKNI